MSPNVIGFRLVLASLGLSAGVLLACGQTSTDSTSAGGDAGALSTSELIADVPACGPIPDEPSAAAEGSLAIRVHIVDGDGYPVLEAPVTLSGASTATHRTNLLGQVTFRVDPGDYDVAGGGPNCRLTPQAEALSGLDTDASLSFVATGDGCLYEDVVEDDGTAHSVRLPFGRMALSVENHGDEEGSVRRIEQIMTSGDDASSCHLEIAGHPAVETLMLVYSAGLQGTPGTTQAGVTTSIHLGSQVLLHTAQLVDPDAGEPQFIALRSARGLSTEDIEDFLAAQLR
jgi:hypothetical protein